MVNYMKIRLFAILALAVCVLGSCTAEFTAIEGGTILAVMDDNQTKTSVSDSGVFTWSDGDQVWLQTTSGNVLGTLSDGAGSASAKFSYGPVIGGELTGRSVYPYNSGHAINADVLDVVLPASYELGAILSNTNAIMYGVNVHGTLKFNHLAGVMRFTFKNVPAGVNKFTLTLDKKINGTFESDLTANYPIVETESTDIEQEKTTTLYFHALTSMSDIKLYVPVPVGTYDALGLALYADEQSVWTYSNTVTNTIARKTLKLMPVVTLSGDIAGDIEGDGDENPDLGDDNQDSGNDNPDLGDENLDMDLLVDLRSEIENNASLLEGNLAVVNDRLTALQADRESDAQVLMEKQRHVSMLEEQSAIYQVEMEYWLRNEMASLEASLCSLEAEIVYNRQNLNYINNQLANCIATFDNCKNEYGESSEKILELETRIQALSVEIQKANDTIVSLTLLLKELENDIDAMYENSTKSSKSKANLSKVSAQKTKVLTKGTGDSALQELEDDISYVSNGLASTVADLESCAEYAAKITNKIQSVENQIPEYKARIEEYQNQMKAIEAELPELNQKDQAMAKVIKDINQKYLYCQDVFAGLSDQILIYKVDTIELYYLINDGSHTDEEMLSLVQKYNKLKNDMETKLEEINAALEVLSNI